MARLIRFLALKFAHVVETSRAAAEGALSLLAVVCAAVELSCACGLLLWKLVSAFLQVKDTEVYVCLRSLNSP